MVKPTKEKWEQDFERLVTKHYASQLQVKRLSRQLQKLMVKHTHLKFNIVEEGRKNVDTMEMIEFLRKQLDRFLLANKGRITPDRKDNLHKMRTMLPTYSLADRIRLMELSVELPKYQSATDSRGNWLRYWHGKDMQRLFGKITVNERKLRRLSKKMLQVISDVHDLHSTIKYVQGTRASKFKIKPFLNRKNWLEPTLTKPEIKATIDMQSKKHHRHRRNLLHVRPPFILKNIPELMPDMFFYLDTD